MAQNLNYSEVITLGTEEQDDDTKVEKYCYNDIPQNCRFLRWLIPMGRDDESTL